MGRTSVGSGGSDRRRRSSRSESHRSPDRSASCTLRRQRARYAAPGRTRCVLIGSRRPSRDGGSPPRSGFISPTSSRLRSPARAPRTSSAPRTHVRAHWLVTLDRTGLRWIRDEHARVSVGASVRRSSLGGPRLYANRRPDRCLNRHFGTAHACPSPLCAVWRLPRWVYRLADCTRLIATLRMR